MPATVEITDSEVQVRFHAGFLRVFLFGQGAGRKKHSMRSGVRSAASDALHASLESARLFASRDFQFAVTSLSISRNANCN